MEYAVRVKAYNYTKSRLPNCLYSIHEYDIASKTKRAIFVETSNDPTSKVEKARKKSRTISATTIGGSASKVEKARRQSRDISDETAKWSASKVEKTRRQSRDISDEAAGGSASKVQKPRGKSRRQLFLNEPNNPATDEDDVPLAIAFGKKKIK